MNKNDIIKMFKSGNSKKFIIDKVYAYYKIQDKKYKKIDAQGYVEMMLAEWWKTA